MNKNWTKLTAVKLFFKSFGSKIAINLSLGLHKGRTSCYRRSLQPSKENIQHFKIWKFLIFSYICGWFLPSWIRILIRIQQLKLMRIHADPDPQPCHKATSQIVKSLSSPGFDPSNLWHSGIREVADEAVVNKVLKLKQGQKSWTIMLYCY